MKSLLTTLINFKEYLLNPDAKKFERLEYYKQESTRLNRDFYKKSIQSIDVQDAMVEILITLNIPKKYWGRYFNNSELSIYEFLKELNEITDKKNKKLKEILQFAEDNNEDYQRKIFWVTWLSIGAFGIIPPFLVVFGQVALTTLQSLLAITLFVPVVGMIYTLGIAAYSIYASYRNKVISWEDRFRENFFNLTSALVNVAAYSLVIAAAATAALNPIAAALFIIASAVLVIKEVVHLVQLNNKPDRKVCDELFETELELQQENARSANQRAKQQNAVIIELVAAVVMVGIVAAWCLVPGGFLVTALALAAISLVAAAKYFASSSNESIMAAKLKEDYKALEDAAEEQETHQAQAEISQRQVLGNLSGQVESNISLLAPLNQARPPSPPPGGFASQGGMFAESARRVTLDDLEEGEEERPTIH